MTSNLPGVLVTSRVAARRRDDLERVIANRARLVLLPEEGALPVEALAGVHGAFLSTDLMRSSNKQALNQYLAAFAGAVEGATQLRWIHTCSSGTDRPLLQQAMARGVAVTTSAGANAQAVAHSALAGMLALARGVPQWVRDQEAKRWGSTSAADAPRDVGGQHVVVVGLGHIGAEVARVCRALRMRVTGVRHRPLPAEDCDRVVTRNQLPDVLPDADWVVLCCPLDASTRGLVDAALLARLPAHACVLNVGRGELVVEADLFAALQAGRLGGVYSDVFHLEPLPPESPWWTLPNALLSPHIGGLSKGFTPRTEEMFLDNLGRWLAGAPLLNPAAPAQVQPR
jgi:D-2-hydroxyacid dehydrogenase (NADP+)